MSNGNNPTTVRFPGNAQFAAGEDVSAPLVQLLRDLHILATETDMEKAGSATSAFTGPPQSVAIIEAGATALGKWWTAALAAGASLTAIVAAIQGIWGNEHDPVRIAFVASAAVVLAAIAIAIGIIVSGDVQGRGAGSLAEYHARAQVAATFLTLSRSGQAPGASSAGGYVSAGLAGRFQGKVKGSAAYEPVTDLRFDPDGGQAEFKIGDDWVAARRVEVTSTG